MPTRMWYAVVALCCVSAPASAQVVLSEADALSRLSTDSPRIRAIRAAIDIARADVLAAGRWPNPRVTFDRESVAGITEDLMTVGQVLPITGRRGLEKSASAALANATSSRVDDELQRMRADLRLAFADLVAVQTRERELTRARDRLRELADILGMRETAGDAAGFDRLRAEREVVELEADLAIAVTDRARAQAMVTSFFAGATDPITVIANEARSPHPPPPAVDALVARAETVRGELTALRHELDAARFAAQAADRRLIPEPEIVVGTKSSTFAGGDVGSVITAQATIPLFDRAQPERTAAQARAAQAKARAEVFRMTLRAQIVAWRAAATERRRLADRYRELALGGGDQVDRIAQVSYDAGERGILELLDA